MKIEKLTNALNTRLGKAGLRLRKHAPEILIVAGAVGAVASTVMACFATTKISTILDKTKEDLNTIHTYEHEDYTETDRKKDLTITYVKTGVRMARLYAPSALLGALSITCMVGSHHILTKRNAALAAAYATVDKSFKEYKKRVAERFGENVEKELRYNIKAKKFKETVVDENSGKEKKTKTTVDVADPDYSCYARFFDETSACWEKDPEYNLTFLTAQQRYANDLLQARGHLFLNEVYDMLGLTRSTAGQVVGWIYGKNNSNGDNYVDFGIFDANREKSRDFVNGYERSILLDFNVDGYILDLL